MSISVEMFISLAAAVITLLLLIFAVDWRYFRDWVVVYLFKSLLDFVVSSPTVELRLLEYPDRLLPNLYDTSLLFELWVFPVLCILYNQITRDKGLSVILGYALLFSAGITVIEYFLELHTNLIRYIQWSWLTTYVTLSITFLLSRGFIAFYRRGCDKAMGVLEKEKAP
ncbi:MULTISPECIES: CBO0543 family protein [Sporomusa]|jgi:hypothetical protein|uniref:CBO0543 family protein n=1 Tax=Sporomusa TaxID=2375 RepID=UPI001669EEFA|nr:MULTISPECIES: CBO0543 family protein [Sporomusa]MCM0761179.1 hypothetical protein [Sporomusa sphaeroides DSM 2875]